MRKYTIMKLEKLHMCPLCKADKLTKWYYEDDVCWVADCKTCGIPMIVLKHHGEPNKNELHHLKNISNNLFPRKRWRGFRRDIKDHWHEHLI